MKLSMTLLCASLSCLLSEASLAENAERVTGGVDSSLFAPKTSDEALTKAFLKLRESPNDFAKRYKLTDTEALPFDDREISIEMFRYSSPPGACLCDTCCGGLPASAYVLSVDEVETVVPGGYVMEHIEAKIVGMDPRFLLIFNPTGGNCSNCLLNIVISLDRGSSLKYIGQAKWNDEWGLSALYRTEDIWEGGLGGLFCHADAPGVRIYCSPQDGVLRPDVGLNMTACTEDIEAANARIASFREGKRTRWEQISHFEVFRDMLMKFLYYRIMGDLDMAWRELRADLRDAAWKDLRVDPLDPAWEDLQGDIGGCSRPEDYLWMRTGWTGRRGVVHVDGVLRRIREYLPESDWREPEAADLFAIGHGRMGG